jgi:hypothetical protein
MHILNFIRMWLFDDILKKPTPPAGQTGTWTDPLMGSGTSGAQGGQAQWSGGTGPVIVKSESSTVFWPNSEADSIRSQNSLPSTPTVHAEEDSSSVLMWAAPVSSAIAPVAPPEAPMIVTPTVEAPPAPSAVQSENIAPTPQVSSTPIQSSPVAASPLPQTIPQEDALQIPAGPSLFDHIMREDEVVAPTPLPVQETAPTAPTAPVESVWVPAKENIATQTTAPTPEISPSPVSPMPVASNYATPREFIEKSIENLDEMLETIDDRHSAKMTEAEWYRMEKMRFAELEKNAYAEAEIMDRERDHTVRMRSIFEKELDTDEANRNKKTVAHTEVHADKHVHAHKRHVHEDEEEVVAAS